MSATHATLGGRLGQSLLGFTQNLHNVFISTHALDTKKKERTTSRSLQLVGRLQVLSYLLYLLFRKINSTTLFYLMAML